MGIIFYYKLYIKMFRTIVALAALSIEAYAAP